MAAALLTSKTMTSFNDPDIQSQVNRLRQTDNLTSWFYLAREYVLLAILIGSTIGFYGYLQTEGASLLWAVPVTLVAIVLIGALQQRLATLTHEAAHYMLFRNRLLNEVVSELFCMFPILGTTHSYRVQHLGHHQYPNDPERDPDWVQMTRSGHRFDFPMTRGRFLWHCVFKQLLLPFYLLRYSLVRATYVVDKGHGTPYRMRRSASRILKLAGLLYHVALIGALTTFVLREDPVLLLAVPAALWLLGIAFFSFAPDRWFEVYFIQSDLPIRAQKCMRITFNTAVLTTLATLTVWTGQPCWLYYFVLWLTPLGTSFAFFMVLRQVVQHGNADQERFTNTRIFRIHWLLSWAIFPIGNDYHLPHHLFPMVPHYNLKALHDLLMRTEEYGNQATVVEGYFLSPENPPMRPTVVDLMTQ